MGNFYLETERLLIKKGTIEDYIKIHEYDFNGLQNIKGNFEYIKLDPNEVRSWFGDSIEDWYEKVEDQKHYQMVVYLKENNEPIANIGFDRNDIKNNSIQVSCWLHPNYWKNGYMKEALVYAMDFIYKQGFDNIIYGYIEGNDNSKRLCEKLRFEPYKINKNDFKTNYGSATEYETIMPKERFYELYQIKLKTK